MTRSILTLSLCTTLGAAFGWFLAAQLGGAFGAVFGALGGTLWLGARSSTHAIAPGASLHLERRVILCVPTGQQAEVELTHDDHHWCDVESCSLCRTGPAVQCRKRCLDWMNDNAPLRREPATA